MDISWGDKPIGGFIGSGGNMEAARQGALTGGLFAGAGQLANSLNAAQFAGFANDGIGRALLHAGAGCISASAGGGDCARGALSAVAGLKGTEFGFLGAIVAGGTVSVIGGGKFGNGAITASFGYLFNFMMHKREVRTYDVLTKEMEAHNRYVLSFSPFSNSDSGLSSAFGLVDEYASTALRGVAKFVYKVIDALVPTGYGTHDLNGLGTKWDAYKLEGQLKALAVTQGLDLGPGGISANQAKAFLDAAQKIPGFLNTYGTSKEFLRQVDQ